MQEPTPAASFVGAKRSKQAFHISLRMSRATHSVSVLWSIIVPEGETISFFINDSSMEHPLAWSEASVLFFPAKVSLYNPGWSGTLYVEQVGLKSSCLYFLKTEITGICHYAQPKCTS